MIGTTRARLPLVPLFYDAAGSWCGLAADIPGPGLAVDVSPAHAGRLSDAGRGAGSELDDVGPSGVATVRARDEGGAELLERVPVGQGEQARVVELVLGVPELALPPGDPSAVVLHDAVAAGLLEHPDQDGEAVLHG
jgi:hypothetical protein